MRLLLLSESIDWKLDVIESYKDIAQYDTGLNDEYKATKGDELQFITYLAFLESTSERGLKYGITARVELIINNNTGDAWIDWIGRGPNRHNETEPLPGYRSLRHLLAQIAKRHPNIKQFTGWRMSGMRDKHPNFNQKDFKLSAGRL
jgi:hypothetical protein